MKKFLNNPYLSLAIRILVGILFVFSGVTKISDSAGFSGELANYNLLPHLTLNFIAITLPWLELVCGIFLISGLRLRTSGAISSFLYFIFLIAVISAIIRGFNINCGCHTGVLTEKVNLNKFFENLGLFILSIYIMLFPVNKITVERVIIKEL